jgi:glycosyltransferase involved in cell wall biosynthesis
LDSKDNVAIMKILFIASGFPPYEFSENIVNGKLVLALIKAGHTVNVITKVDDGITYNSQWSEPWFKLQKNTYLVSCPVVNKFRRVFEILSNSIKFKYFMEGIRWAGLAYDKSVEFIENTQVDVIITRSPSDIAHLVGLRLRKKFNIKWIANWNDPSLSIWPEPYQEVLPMWKKWLINRFTAEALFKADLNTFPSQLLKDHFANKFNNFKSEIIPHIMLSYSSNVTIDEDKMSLKICHSGNLSLERDPENLFLALKRNNINNKLKIHLDILGVATPFALSLVEKHNLEKYVNFTKPMPYTLALKKMTEYDVLLILEAKMDKSIFLPSKIADYVTLNKPILSISPVISEIGVLINKYGGGLMANNIVVDNIYEKLVELMNLKLAGKLNEIVEKSKLNEYMGETIISSKFNKILKNG